MKWLTIRAALRRSRADYSLNASVKKKRRNGSDRAAPSRLLPLLSPAVLLALIGGGGWWFLTHSPYFRVARIEVVNQHSYTAAEIMAMAQVSCGENIFRMDLAAGRGRLTEEVNIRDASLERLFPDTVRVRVFEREPRARVKFGRYYTVDDRGVVLRERKEVSGGSLPVITGVKIKDGLIYPPSDGESVLAILRAMDQRGISSYLDVSEMDATDSETIVLRTAQNLEVKMARADLSAQLERLEVVLPHLSGNAAARSVDLRYPDVPVSYDNE
jgi:cell division protein FtsQ